MIPWLHIQMCDEGFTDKQCLVWLTNTRTGGQYIWWDVSPFGVLEVAAEPANYNMPAVQLTNCSAEGIRAHVARLLRDDEWAIRRNSFEPGELDRDPLPDGHFEPSLSIVDPESGRWVKCSSVEEYCAWHRKRLDLDQCGNSEIEM